MKIQDRSGAWLSLEFDHILLESWVVLRAKAASQWFRGGIQLNLHRGEIEALIQSLGHLQEERAGSYSFDSYEGELQMDFAMGKREDLAISVRLQNPGLLHELRLYLNVDQTYLPELVQGFRDILAAS